MGSSISSDEREAENKRETMRRGVNRFTKYADLSVNRSIQMFCSSSSSDHLQQHLNKKKVSYPAADWLKKLADKLAGLCKDPKLAGIGALAIAVFIDIITAKPSSSEAIKEALRSVFAEQKASEVWVQIDECLKRCIVNMSDQQELVRDLKRIEVNLSEALTRLKRSMDSEGHMNAEALQAWVNGAVFHVQMAVHLVRLGGFQSNSQVEALLFTYLSDLELLFEKHKKMARSKWSMSFTLRDPDDYNCLDQFVTETGERQYMDSWAGNIDTYFEAYYEKNYSSQRVSIRRYFEEVRDNLSALVRQQGNLRIY